MTTKAELEAQLERATLALANSTELIADYEKRDQASRSKIAELEQTLQERNAFLAQAVQETDAYGTTIDSHVDTIKAMDEASAALEAQVAKWEARYAQETSDEIKAITSRRCINCGNPGRVSYDGETEKFTCASCKYSWEIAEEQSPHRKR